MTKREKRLQKIRHNANDVSFDELHHLLADYGFTLRRITGSHHIFEYTLNQKRLKFIVPMGRPLKSYYVKEALRLIDLMAKEGDESANDE